MYSPGKEEVNKKNPPVDAINKNAAAGPFNVARIPLMFFGEPTVIPHSNHQHVVNLKEDQICLILALVESSPDDEALAQYMLQCMLLNYSLNESNAPTFANSQEESEISTSSSEEIISYDSQAASTEDTGEEDELSSDYSVLTLKR